MSTADVKRQHSTVMCHGLTAPMTGHRTGRCDISVPPRWRPQADPDVIAAVVRFGRERGMRA